MNTREKKHRKPGSINQKTNLPYYIFNHPTPFFHFCSPTSITCCPIGKDVELTVPEDHAVTFVL